MNRLSLQTLFAVAVAALLAGVNPTIASANDAGETIAFRLADWKASHFNTPQEAQQHADTLRKLGCEVAIEQHGGHIDVKTRTGGWKSVTVASHALCDQWEGWLKAAGFETLHGHAHAPTPGAIAVQYQLANWKAIHFNDLGQATEAALLFKALGCEVQQGNHAGHIDVSIRCAKPCTLVCNSHEQAHGLQAWLNQNGFQTQHAH